MTDLVPAVRRKNDYIPLEVGGQYKLSSAGGGQWVEIVSISNSGMIGVRGIDSTIAAWELPAWHFDDVIAEYYNVGQPIIAPNWSVMLVDENDILITGG